MDVDRLLPARGKERLHRIPRIPLPPELVQGEDAVHLEAILVAGAAGGGGEGSVLEDSPDAFGLRVCLLAPVVGPGLLGEWEFGGGEFAGGGGGKEVNNR